MLTIQMLNALTTDSPASLQGVITTPPAWQVPLAGGSDHVQVEPVGVFRRDQAGQISFESYVAGRWCLLDPARRAWSDGEASLAGVPAAYAYADQDGRAYAQTAWGWMMFDSVRGWIGLG